MTYSLKGEHEVEVICPGNFPGLSKLKDVYKYNLAVLFIE
jgi:hypothetical protein